MEGAKIDSQKVRLQAHRNMYTCFSMKNVTLGGDERLIEQARMVARSQHKALNVAFRLEFSYANLTFTSGPFSR
jgi:hypothetical protein